MANPTQAEIENKLRGEDLNTWLDSWRAERAPAQARRTEAHGRSDSITD